MTQMPPLARRIIQAREARGWNRKQLAVQSGVKYTTLRNIEVNTKEVQPTEENLQLLATALEVPFDELRILAGYLITQSTDSEHRKKRIATQLAANPRLDRALTALLQRNDANKLDQAATYLEWLADHPEAPLRTKAHQLGAGLTSYCLRRAWAQSWLRQATTGLRKDVGNRVCYNAAQRGGCL